MRLRACTLALVLAVLAWVPARAEDVVLVVVNPATPVGTLSSTDIRDAYLGETAFWGQVKIHPATLRVPPELLAGFLAATLATTPSEYERAWMMRVFRDGGMPPRGFDTPADLLRYVARTPGAVGFVRPADLPDKNAVRVAARIPIANAPTPRPRRARPGA
jgi:hypothetical protein